MSKNIEVDVVEVNSNSKIIQGPKFLNPKDLPPEALTDPDYHIKQLQKQYGGNYSISCSKCHHCR